MTEYSKRRDFMFCKLCGTMLDFKSTKHVECPLCPWKRSLKEIAGREISYRVTAEDIRRELNIEQFVNPDGVYVNDKVEIALTRTEHKCEKCGHMWATYTSQQMRSADEGETKIYTCENCKATSQD